MSLTRILMRVVFIQFYNGIQIFVYQTAESIPPAGSPPGTRGAQRQVRFCIIPTISNGVLGGWLMVPNVNNYMGSVMGVFSRPNVGGTP